MKEAHGGGSNSSTTKNVTMLNVLFKKNHLQSCKGLENYFFKTLEIHGFDPLHGMENLRTGYAFKEAHGGGSIGGFLSAVVGSAMVQLPLLLG